MTDIDLKRSLHIVDWGLVAYVESLARQGELVRQRQGGDIIDQLIIVEYSPVITFGRRAGNQDLLLPSVDIEKMGVDLHAIDRGGQATAHEPGQMVVYPIIYLHRKNLRWYIDHSLASMVNLLRDYGLEPELKAGNPGVWVQGKKIASFGIAVKRWVTSHGMALNVTNDLNTFSMIVPCGAATEQMTTMERELGRVVDIDKVKKKFVSYFCDSFGYEQ